MNRKLLPGVLLQLHFCRPQFQASEQLMAGLSLLGFKVFLLQKAWKKCGHTSRAGSCSVRTGVENERGGSWWSSVTVNLCCFLSAVLLFSMDKAAFWVTFQELLFFVCLFSDLIVFCSVEVLQLFLISIFSFFRSMGRYSMPKTKESNHSKPDIIPALPQSQLFKLKYGFNYCFNFFFHFFLFFFKVVLHYSCKCIGLWTALYRGSLLDTIHPSKDTCGKGIENPAPKNAMFITWWFQRFLTEKHSWQGFSG